MGCLLDLENLKRERVSLRNSGSLVVFTNGVFDILHRGHCEYLEAARNMGDILIVGLNSDASVRRLRGELKPIVPQEDRAVVLCSLRVVDYVILFDEDTPIKLISTLLPDVLVKGGDYSIDDIVGRREVEHAGGRVLTIPLLPERSSTNIIATIIERYCKQNK